MPGKTENDAQDRDSNPWAGMTAAEWEALDEVSRNLMQASLKSQKLMSEAMQKALEGEAVLPKADPFNAAPEFGEVWNHIVHQPELMMQAQADLMKGYLDLWSNTTKRFMAGEDDAGSAPVIEPEKGDKRWKSEDWSTNPVFNAIKQSYLLNQHFLMGLVRNVDGVDERTRRKVEFLSQVLTARDHGLAR